MAGYVVGLCFITPRERKRMRKLVSICRYIYIFPKKKKIQTPNTFMAPL